MIVQGDKYYVTFKIKRGNEYITPSTANIQGVKIQIGNVIKRWTPNGTDNDLTFADGSWRYSLSQEQSYNLCRETLAQAQIKIQNEIFSTFIKHICVHNSIIKELWNNG